MRPRAADSRPYGYSYNNALNGWLFCSVPYVLNVLKILIKTISKLVVCTDSERSALAGLFWVLENIIALFTRKLETSHIRPFISGAEAENFWPLVSNSSEKFLRGSGLYPIC